MLQKIRVRFIGFILGLASRLFLSLLLEEDDGIHLKALVQELDKEELTGRQKYNRAKKFLDSVMSEGISDQIKNTLIELTVLRLTKNVTEALRKV